MELFQKIKEKLRGTDCWNCKRKNNCKVYQATKHQIIKEKMEMIDLDRLIKYLKSKKWVLDGAINDIAYIWHRNEEEFKDFEILLPINKELRDYYDRLFDAINVLSEFYQKDIIYLLNDIIGFYSDNIKIQ